MTLRQFFGLVELRTKVVSVSTFALSLLYSLFRLGRIDPLLTVLAFFAVLLVDMATTAFNSFFDKWKGLDRPESNQEADKVLVHEGVPALAALFIGLGLYAGAGLFGIAIALRTGPWVVFAGAVSMLAGFLYSGGPMPISRTPLGELVAGAFLGSFLFLIIYRIEGGVWDLGAFLSSLPGAAMIGSILAVNNACDREEDMMAGRRTFAVLAGPRAGRVLGLVLVGAAIVLPSALSALAVLPWPAAAGGLAALPWAFGGLRAMLRRGFSAATKSANMVAIVRILAVWSSFLALGLGASVVQKHFF